MHRFASFVANTEFIYENMPFPSKEVEEEYGRIWWEMELVNADILCEWEKQGYPKNWDDWSKYKQDVEEVVTQYITFMTNHFLR